MYGKFGKVDLRSGGFELVPANTVVLNPELEGMRAHAWGVWAFRSDAPCDLAGAVRGECVGPLMAYLSDRDDLWKFGHPEIASFKNESDAMECMEQVVDLQALAFDLMMRTGADAGLPFGVAWVKFDMASRAKFAPMGRSPRLFLCGRGGANGQ